MFAHPHGPVLRVSAADGRTAAFARPTHLTEEKAAAVGGEYEALLAGPAPHLTLDLGAVEFVSSVGLAQLLTLSRRARTAGGSLRLTNLRQPVRQVFLMSRLDRVLDIDAGAVA